jgi:hypothetical protein
MDKGILIKVKLKNKLVIWFRLLMIILACISLLPIWGAISDGYFVTRGIRQESDGFAIVFYSLKFVLAAGLFIWLATGGVMKKEGNDTKDSKQD